MKLSLFLSLAEKDSTGKASEFGYKTLNTNNNNNYKAMDEEEDEDDSGKSYKLLGSVAELVPIVVAKT